MAEIGMSGKSMSRRLKSLILVAIQFICLVAIALTGPIIARQPLLLFVEILGIGLGIWAILSMRPFNFNITPDVKTDGVMVERGPYTYIRHPMYAALLTICTALVIDQFSLVRLGILLILIIDLVVKLRYEENLLASHYSEYDTYRTHTYRLVPYLW